MKKTVPKRPTMDLEFVELHKDNSGRPYYVRICFFCQHINGLMSKMCENCGTLIMPDTHANSGICDEVQDVEAMKQRLQMEHRVSMAEVEISIAEAEHMSLEELKRLDLVYVGEDFHGEFTGEGYYGRRYHSNGSSH